MELTITIDQLLCSARPDRYDAADHSWRNDVYRIVASTLDPDEAQMIAAKVLVDKRETKATRTANRVFREIARNGTWPADWLDLADVPISIDNERVCLRVVTAEELLRWSGSERREAAADFSARNDACKGAEMLAKQMTAVGALTLLDLMSTSA